MLDNYRIDEFGVIHQIEWTSKTYDDEYLSYYEGLRERTIKLGYQRCGWVVGRFGGVPRRVLEIGYGLGTYLEAASLSGSERCAGFDVARYPLPAGCEFVEWKAALSQSWDVVAMFDVLEHIPDLSFLGELETEAIAVAVPFCRQRELGDAWFRDWRMRLPNEHLHHFDEDSLNAMLGHYGYECEQVGWFEDGLRLRDDEAGPNILTAYYRRIVEPGPSKAAGVGLSPKMR